MTEQSEVTVLHVDDNIQFTELTAEMLTSQDSDISVISANTVSEGITLVESTQVDCIVSDYDMPTQNGINFLTTIREDYPDLPFILFTSKGSEEIASEAISAGVTDYIQKSFSNEQYELLANRISNAVTGYHAEKKRQQWKEAIETAAEGIAIVGADGEYLQVNEAYAAAYNESPTTLIGTNWQEWSPKKEITRYHEEILSTLQQQEQWEGESLGLRKDGSTFEQHLSLSSLDDGHVCVMEDISERKRREKQLNALHDATRTLMQSRHKQAVAEKAVSIAETALDQDINALWLYDPDDDVLQPAAISEKGKEVVGDPPVYTGAESLSWKVFQQGSIEIYDDIQSESTRVNEDTPIRSEIILALGDYGVMNMGSTEPADFETRDVSMAQIFANTVETALDRASREQQIREQREEIKQQKERLERFAGVVSQDLRYPLEIAERRVERAQTKSNMSQLDGVETALEWMDTLVTNLTTLTQEETQTQNIDAVALSEIAKECQKQTQSSKASVDIDTNALIRANQTRLKQLIENLIQCIVEQNDERVNIHIGETDDGFYIADTGFESGSKSESESESESESGIPSSEYGEVSETGCHTTDTLVEPGLRIVEETIEFHGWTAQRVESDRRDMRIEIADVDFVEN
jgi:PAS domain S-box-containing protein